VTETNQFGLSRNIPRDVRRAVRKRCGFTCVCCEAGIFQYHHFRPSFAEAKGHDPDGITLLCGTHHQAITGGLWSDDEIARRDAQRRGTPVTGNVMLDVREPIVVALGSIVMLGHGPLLTVDGEPLLTVSSDPTRGMILSGRLYDQVGQLAVSIERNTLVTRSETWDVELVGPLITIRSGPNQITAVIRLHPPHSVHVERLDFAYKGWRFYVDAARAKVWIGDARVEVRPTVDPAESVGTLGGGVPGMRPTMDFVNTVAWVGGALSLEGMSFSMNNGAAIDPAYSGDRFAELTRAGRLDVVMWELLRQPTLRVVNRGGRWQVTRTDFPAKEAEVSTFVVQRDAVAAARALLGQLKSARLVLHEVDGTWSTEFGETPDEAIARMPSKPPAAQAP
jgi:hypothetical protein